MRHHDRLLYLDGQIAQLDGLYNWADEEWWRIGGAAQTDMRRRLEQRRLVKERVDRLAQSVVETCKRFDILPGHRTSRARTPKVPT